MTDTTRISRAAATAEANAFSRLLDGGRLEIRTGPQPATPDEPAVGEVLASFRFESPAARPAEAGVVTFHPLIETGLATGSGHAEHFRAYRADGTAVWDGSVGTSNATLIIGGALIRAGGRVVPIGATFIIAPG